MTASRDCANEPNEQTAIRVAALIVTWNRRDDVLECIDSLVASSHPNLSVYVVDNASQDDTCDAIAAKYPQVRLIRSEQNLGFAGGNNLGLTQILEDGAEAAFLVNDDVVVAPDALSLLIDSGFDDLSVGVASPKVVLHSEPAIIWSAGGLIDIKSGVATQRCYGESDDRCAERPSDIDYAVGCAMLVKTSAMRRAGLFDERYFMYYEEADWCRRIREAGCRITYVPSSRVSHKVTLSSTSRNSASYYFARNRLLYLRSAGTAPICIARVATTDLLRTAISCAIKGRKEESRLTLRGVADYYSNRFGKLESAR